MPTRARSSRRSTPRRLRCAIPRSTSTTSTKCPAPHQHRRHCAARLPALWAERSRTLRQDGPQRRRVRNDGCHRRGLEHHPTCRRGQEARGDRRRDDSAARSLGLPVRHRRSVRLRTSTDGTAPHGYLHCGPSGAGHFVKMVHNGVEYGMMAAIAEGLSIIQHADAGKKLEEIDAETTPLRDPSVYQYDIDEVSGSARAPTALRRTVTCTVGRAEPDTSSRWSTTASSTE